MEEPFKKRINYHGELEDISLQICKDYKLGKLKSNELVMMGYEDFNFIIETAQKKYFVKVFSNFRTLDDCIRYVNVITSALGAGIATPPMLKSEQGYLHKMDVNNTNLRLCVLDFIDGKNLYESGQNLNADEIKFIARQAALINSINIKPSFIYDHWAITNFLKEYNIKSKCLMPDDLKLLKPLVPEFKSLGIESLPHCFVHGDIRATNLMKDKRGKLWIIDFAVSNYYPRIQELAVLACNLLFNAKDKAASAKNLSIALEEYQKKIKLTPLELKKLPAYIKLAHAMHVLNASFEKVNNHNTSIENEYWLGQGRAGLRQMSQY